MRTNVKVAALLAALALAGVARLVGREASFASR